jgi:prephenate dehydrogenase
MEIVHLKEREARKSSSRRTRLRHQDTVPVARRLYLQLRTSDLIVLSVPPRISWEVAKQLEVTTHPAISVPLHHGEVCKYGV